MNASGYHYRCNFKISEHLARLVHTGLQPVILENTNTILNYRHTSCI